MINLLPDCERFYRLNDNLANTVVLDMTQNEQHGTGSRNTEDLHLAFSEYLDLKGAFYFNSALSDYVTIPQLTLTAPFSFAFVYQGVIAKSWGDFGDECYFGKSGDTNNLFGQFDGSNALILSFESGRIVVWTENVIDPSLTSYIVVTVEIGNTKLYVNDVLQDEIADNTYQTESLIIDRIAMAYNNRYLHGNLHYIGFWNRILTSAEITWLHSGGGAKEIINTVPRAVHHYQMAR